MTETVTLRPATADDYDFLYQVHCAALRPYIERTWGWDESWQARYFQERFDPAKRQVIRCADVDVGVWSVEERAEGLSLALIAILPRYQRRGIGSALMCRLLDEAEERGVPVTLQVLKVNPARALYERLGFVVTDETDTHYVMKASQTQGREPDERQTG
jgi:ribosomal protein S18 acetylase RimI-like enzyme